MDVLPLEKCNQMEGMTPETAYRHAIGLLVEQGIENPEAYLNLKGVGK